MSTTVGRKNTRKAAINGSIFNAASKINRLPVELLTTIFTLIAPPFASLNFKYFQLRLSWVCHYWRLILLENPVFWRVISFSWKKKDKTKCIEEFLRRSGSMPLIVFGPSSYDCAWGTLPGVVFREFLRRESRRIKLLFYNYAIEDSRHPRPTELDFDNLRDLTLNHLFPEDIIYELLSIAKNIEAFHLTTNKEVKLLGVISRLSPNMRRLSFANVQSQDGVPEIFSRFKKLEYISVIFDPINTSSFQSFSLSQPVTLLNLTTLKMNSFGLIIDHLDAPVLKHLSITAPKDRYIVNDYRLLDSMDLSAFTHLYIGHMPPLRDAGSHGCIWAATGYTAITCLHDRQRCFDNSDLESLIHIHTSLTGHKNFRLPSKLLSKMKSLITLVLSLPRFKNSIFNPIDDPLDIIPSGTSILKEVAQSSLGLRRLIVRGDYVRVTDLEMLSDYLYGYFVSSESCPLLESITFSPYNLGPGTVKGKVLGEFWVNFLTVRKASGCPPLEYVRLEGCPSVPRRFSLQIKELGTVLIQILRIEGPGSAYVQRVGF